MLFTKTQSSVEQAVWPPKSGRPSFDAAPPAFHIRLLGRLLVGRGFRNRNRPPPLPSLRRSAARSQQSWPPNLEFSGNQL